MTQSREQLRLYWSASKPNVGDWLSPLIVGAMTEREIVHSPIKGCDMIAIGSILQKARSHWWSRRLDVWGSGLMFDCKPIRVKHRIHAVRGQLTRERLIGHSNVACGDPGLMLSRVLEDPVDSSKPIAVGVVPHYWDREDSKVKRFLARYPGAKFLDIFSDVEDFIRDMNQCQCILSSSLHGLVMADSFGIPNQWLVISDKVEGDNFKFRDYYSVFDMNCPDYRCLEDIFEADVKEIIQRHQRPGLESVIEGLESSFPQQWR